MQENKTKETGSKRTNFINKIKFIKEDSMSTSHSSTESSARTNVLLD